jgi:hypothetical protein
LSFFCPNALRGPTAPSDRASPINATINIRLTLLITNFPPPYLAIFTLEERQGGCAAFVFSKMDANTKALTTATVRKFITNSKFLQFFALSPD